MKKIDRRKVIKNNPLWNVSGSGFVILIVILTILAAVMAYYVAKTFS